MWPRLVIPEVAEQLRCGHSVAYRLMSSGEIESALIAGKWTCSQAALDKYVERKTRDGVPSYRRRRKRRMA